MTKRQVIIDTIAHKNTHVIPYNLDLTHDVEKRLAKEFDDNNFAINAGSYIVTQRNEEFIKLDEKRQKDQFGVVWLMDQKGDFGIVDEIILKEPTLVGYEFPKPNEKEIRRKCEWLISENNKDLFKMYIIGFSLFERAWALRGMENLLTDFILEPDFTNELFNKICDYNMQVAEIAMEYPIDGIFYGDDWGQQKGLIMGPQHWREFIKPHLRKMYKQIKESGFYVCQHSCGDIVEVFPDLIEIGLDIYNTFQPEIYDIEKVKNEFGDKLVFYGGISTQHEMPYCTPEEVKVHMKKIINVMSKNGGYIVAPTHSIPDDVPTENILAFLEVVKNYSK